ncbi:MAG TPA: RHS repeat-associated core domain-containing protein [Oculatellaceae cyanobacterium]
MKNWLKNPRKPSVGNSKVTRSYTGITWAVVAVTSVTIALCVAASATNPAKTVYCPDSETQLSGPKPMDPQAEAIVNNLVNRGVTPNRSAEMAQRAAAGLDPVDDPTEAIAQASGLQPAKIQAGNQKIAQVQQLAQGSGGNSSQFVYDPYGRCVKIMETRNGSVTSTKQFIWDADRLCEERDSSGNVTKQFFALGQTITGTPYYYTRDQVNSVREMTDASGNIVAAYSYTPDGRATKLQGNTVNSDFGYAGMYAHLPSGLKLAIHRDYYPVLGRWLNRDPVGERAGANLYAYVGNHPIDTRDPLGLGPYGLGFDWNSGITWGNWGGWNYTNGGVGRYGELDPFPGSGGPGVGKTPYAPTDPTDQCFLEHDRCLNLAARIQNPKPRQCLRRDCDTGLANCLLRNHSPLAPVLGPIFGNPWSPNNNPGTWHPELGPDPTIGLSTTQ